MRSLTITVDADSEAFDVDGYGSYVTGNTVTNIIKAGDGELALGNADFSAYTGCFTVAEGVLSFTDGPALGAVTAKVSVKNGGTLLSRVGTINYRLDADGTKIVEFEGAGADGMGALAFGSIGQSTGVFGKKFVMTGDAVISGENVFGFVYGTELDMGGHELECRGLPSYQVVLSGLNILNPGSITVVGGGTTSVSNGRKWDGGPENRLVIPSGTLNMYSFTKGTASSPIVLPWTLDFNGNPDYAFTFGYNKTDYKLDPAYNCWQGPVIIGHPRVKVLMTASSVGGSFAGKVSGGGFFLEGNVTGDKPTRNDSHLHLSNPGNDFTGGVKVASANLHLWADGALPATGGYLHLVDSCVYLEATNSSYTLPGLLVEGQATVSGGYGSWSGGIVKKGEGELRLKSFAGAPSLEVRGGSVTLPAACGEAPGSALAGLIGGAYYSNYHAASAVGPCPTNSVALYPEAMYDSSHEYWKNLYNPEDETDLKRGVVYHGYLWNRGPDAVWTFAGSVNMHFGLFIDGERVIYQTKGNGGIWAKTNVTVTTGPHTIQIRVYATDNGGPSMDSSNDGAPWQKLGFPRYDPLGRDSTNSVDYVKLEDPGDGSLLTWDLPGKAEYVHPVTGEPVVTVPAFGSMVFTNGTSLACSSNHCTVADLAGFPTLTECPVFTVTNRWTLSAQEADAGAVLSTDGVLSFGDGAVLEVSGKVRHVNPVAVATAAGGIAGMPSLEAGARWTLSRSDDGKTLYLTRLVNGLVLGIR